MSERMYGSIDVTKIIELMTGGHSSLSKNEKNGHVYMNVVQWHNDEEDEYGNKASIQPNCSKNATEIEKTATKKIYLGNLKLAKAEPPNKGDIDTAKAALEKMGGAVSNNVQQAEVISTTPAAGNGAPTKIVDDLPF